MKITNKLIIGIISVMSVISVCHAEDPVAVSGRYLENNSATMDTSRWIEIARYRGHSLIFRVDPLLDKPIHFDQSSTYAGYTDSSAQVMINRWFDRLSPESSLKRYAVGNTAVSNIGCYREISDSTFQDVYRSPRPCEEQGNGISLPIIEGTKSAFLPSFQEAKKYVSYSSDKECDSYKNYNMLQVLSLLYFPENKKYIKDSWLRSPGEYTGTCSYLGRVFLTGSINCKSVQSECFIRPCIWVDSKIFSDDGQTTTSGEELRADKLKRPVDEICSPLNSMVGMRDFKETVRKLILKERNAYFDRQAGLDVKSGTLHMVLTGNPGTGKTTVAEKFCEVLYNAGLIEQKELIKVEKKDLVGKYIGHTESNVNEILEKAKGKVLFIDEAYTLSSGGERDFGKHVIDGILTAMTENKCVIIVAGYPEPMREFLDSNAGLQSRFSQHVHLNDYSPEELFIMFKNLCEKSGFVLDNELESKNLLMSHFQQKLRDRNFGNGRYVKKIYDTVFEERSELIPVNATASERKLIKTLYIQKAIERNS